MLSAIADLSIPFNASHNVVVDVSLYKFITLQFVEPTGTINLTGTNDSGAVEGVSTGNASTAINFTAIQATNLATGTTVTGISAAGLYQIEVGCKFIQIGGAAAAATKLLVLQSKTI